TPVRVSLASLAVTQLLNAVFLVFVPSLRHAALALSISIAATFNALVLWFLMRRSGDYHAAPGWAAFLMKLAVAVYMMGGALWYSMGSEASWFAIAAGERALKLPLALAPG